VGHDIAGEHEVSNSIKGLIFILMDVNLLVVGTMKLESIPKRSFRQERQQILETVGLKQRLELVLDRWDGRLAHSRGPGPEENVEPLVRT